MGGLPSSPIPIPIPIPGLHSTPARRHGVHARLEVVTQGHGSRERMKRHSLQHGDRARVGITPVGRRMQVGGHTHLVPAILSWRAFENFSAAVVYE